MSPTVSFGAQSAPCLSPNALQRRRIAARVNVSPEVADVLALHAYGQPRANVVLINVSDAGSLFGEAAHG